MKMGYVTLYVEDIPAAIAFYGKIFGLTLRFKHESGEYAEMETGNTVLAFAHHDLASSLVPEGYQQANISSTPLGMQVGFEVEDVNGLYDRAVEAGAKPVAEPEDKPWGFKSAMVLDPNGHLVELYHALHPVNPS